MTASKRKPLVAVIGDAKVEPDSFKDVEAERVGTLLVERGCRVLTGGLGGVMEAACRGARRASSYTAGDTVGLLPGTDPDDANLYVDIVLPTGLDHGRNLLVAQADAVVAIGGGAGTLAEIAFAWIHKRLIVALRADGWSDKVADTRIDDRQRYPSLAEDRVFGAADGAAAVDLVLRWLPTYSDRHRRIRR